MAVSSFVDCTMG